MRFSGARQIWHDCFMSDYHAADPMASPGTRDGNDGRIWEHVQKGRAQGVIAGLKPLLRSWGMYAYTNMDTEDDMNRIADHLLHNLQPKLERNCFMLTARVMMLIPLVMQNEARRLNGGAQQHSRTEISQHLGITDPANYYKSWRVKEERIGQVIDEIDRRALGPVSELIEEVEH